MPNPDTLGILTQILNGKEGVIGRLPDRKPIVRNLDGSVSTHRNMTVSIGGFYFLMPTMFGGKKLKPDEAIRIARKNSFIDPDTGQPIPRFKTLEQAKAFEKSQRPFLNEIGIMLSSQEQGPSAEDIFEFLSRQRESR